jgi:PAN domain.
LVKNYINSTTSLASGDFIGSNDGSIYLMMQSDGNLVLYTSHQTSNCKQLSNGFMGGGPGANAIYELNQVGQRNKLYDVAYVDQNSKSYLYPESSVTSTNTYSKVNAYDSQDKNISGGQTSGVDLEQCKQSCNLNAKCYGVEYNTDIKTCLQKDETIYELNPTKLPNSSFSELYIKNKNISEGFTQTNVDTVKLTNYVSGNKSFSNDVVATLTKQINPVDKQQLEQLDSQLSLLSAQLNTDNNNSAHSLVNIDKKSNIQTKFINLFANQYDDTKSKINNLHENMPNYTNIVEDSNIAKSSSINTFIMWCFIFVILLLIMIKIYRDL